MTELAKRNVNLGSLCCKLCGEANESLEHLLVSCSFAEGVWEFIASWCRIPMRPVMKVKDVVDFGAHVKGCARWRKLVNGIMRVGVWCIWNCRNEAVFKQKERSIEEIKDEIKQSWFHLVKESVKGSQLNLVLVV
ncbi:putative reverse transcriptase zinc-binding domain-containing protein [Helianthus annuus]|nr:putative reverse transcriptase zinc-binding domain-containing protein [Helianthus annuus]